MSKNKIIFYITESKTKFAKWYLIISKKKYILDLNYLLSWKSKSILINFERYINSSWN